MGRVTDLAWRAVTGDPEKSRRYALQAANNFNNDPNVQVYNDKFLKVQPKTLWGTLYVKDVTVNANYSVQYIGKSNNKHDQLHVETVLMGNLVKSIKDGLVLPASCKIIICIGQSPCKQCSEELIRQCQVIRGHLPAAQFSFNFREYYIKRDRDDSRLHLFRDKLQADKAYAGIQKKADELQIPFKMVHSPMG